MVSSDAFDMDRSLDLPNIVAVLANSYDIHNICYYSSLDDDDLKEHTYLRGQAYLAFSVGVDDVKKMVEMLGAFEGVVGVQLA